MENRDKTTVLGGEKLKDPKVSKVNEILRDFVGDLNAVMTRKDIDKIEKNNQVSVAGWILYNKLPEFMKIKELSTIIGVTPSTIKRWKDKGFISPTQTETRSVFVGATFTARPAVPSLSPMLFDRDQIMTSLLLVSHKEVSEFRSKDIKKVLDEPDWSFNPNNLNWICYFLVNRSKWKDYYNK